MNLLSLIIKLGVDKADYEAKMASAEKTAATTADRMVNKFRKKFTEGILIGAASLFTRQTMQTAKDWATIGANAEKLGLIFDQKVMNELGATTRAWENLFLQMQLTVTGPLNDLMNGLRYVLDGLAAVSTVIGAATSGMKSPTSYSPTDFVMGKPIYDMAKGFSVDNIATALNDLFKRIESREYQLMQNQLGNPGLSRTKFLNQRTVPVSDFKLNMAQLMGVFSRGQTDSLAKIGGYAQTANPQVDLQRKSLTKLEQIKKNTDSLNVQVSG